MEYTKSQITSYAHDYLSGSNLVPIGVLDDKFFKSECRRLWGPEPTREEKIKQIKRDHKMLDRLVVERNKLVGPRGGKPKSGEALYQYKWLEAHISALSLSVTQEL